MKTLHTVVAVIGFSLAGAGAWWWQNARPAATAPAAGSAAQAAVGPARAAGGLPAVEVGRAEAVTLTDEVRAVGSLRAAQGVMLRPEVSGRVARLGFKDGQRVRRGQLLVQLDDTLQQAQLKQAQAQAGIARTNLQRSRELLAQGFVSQSAVDQNAAALDVAEAQVALTLAQLARMHVVAPFDATAGIRRVDLGDYVREGADLVNLENLTVLTVDFSVPERYLSRLKAGQDVRVTVDAMPERVFEGRVDALDSAVDADGRALLVRARVDNPGDLLRPGMFARPQVVFAVREGAVTVPEEALVPRGSRQFVYKVVDTGDGRRTAQQVEAQIGLRLPGRVELLEGVAAGDLVVTAGHERLRGGEVAVRVIDLSRPSLPAAAGESPAPGSRPAAAG